MSCRWADFLGVLVTQNDLNPDSSPDLERAKGWHPIASASDLQANVCKAIQRGGRQGARKLRELRIRWSIEVENTRTIKVA